MGKWELQCFQEDELFRVNGKMAWMMFFTYHIQPLWETVAEFSEQRKGE